MTARRPDPGSDVHLDGTPDDYCSAPLGHQPPHGRPPPHYRRDGYE